MAGSQRKEFSIGSSLEDYDKLFDAQNTLEDTQRAASSHRLPVVDEEYHVPTPYDREETQLDFNAHHSAVYYPHVHQTLRNSGSHRRRKKKEKDRKYKKHQGSRPSQLFQPSLQGVAEQETEHQEYEGEDGVSGEEFDKDSHRPGVQAPVPSDSHGVNNSSTGFSTKSIESEGGEQQVQTSQGADNSADSSSQSSVHMPAVSGAKPNDVKFTLGDTIDQDSVDRGLVLVIPKHAAVSSLKSTNSAPNRLSPSADAREPVKFVLGGGEGSGSRPNVLEKEGAADRGRAAADTESKGGEHVTFILGGESNDNFQKKPAEPGHAAMEAARHRSRSSVEDPADLRMHQISAMKSRSYSYHPGDDLASIRCRGSDVELSDLPNRMMARITSPEEAAALGNHGLEDLASRFSSVYRGY